MPCFRGIDLSVVSSADHSVFPEFPHPDGSSARFGGLNVDRQHRSSLLLSPRPRAEAGDFAADDNQKVTPRISVYIPSAPGSSFSIHYSISQPPISHKYLFFKVYINGRHIVAWGINLHKTTSGATHQALFQPSELYQYNDNGVVISEPGIESRSFRFVLRASSTAAASVAEDGGLVEVQVFRAIARRRRSPQLEKWLDRGKYGIALASNGLLENPHLADYYDYCLTDARDLPYSSFLFHYRSWENLRLLQLAPSERPAFLCPASPSVSAEAAPSLVDSKLVGLKDQAIRPAREQDGPAPHSPSPARPLPPLPYPPALRVSTNELDGAQKEAGTYEQDDEEACGLDADKHPVLGLRAEDDVFWSPLYDSPDQHTRDKSGSARMMLFPFTDNLCKRKVDCTPSLPDCTLDGHQQLQHSDSSDMF